MSVSLFFSLDLYIFIINRWSKLAIFEQNTVTLNDGKKHVWLLRSWKVEITRRNSSRMKTKIFYVQCAVICFAVGINYYWSMSI